MSEPVLDASAFLAYLQAEPGAEVVQKALARGCCMSAVNWAEVLSKVAELGKPGHDLEAHLERRQLLGTALRILPFAREDASVVGDLRLQTRHLGLSLGDRACLALGQRLGALVLTADRTWARLDGQVAVQVIR